MKTIKTITYALVFFAAGIFFSQYLSTQALVEGLPVQRADSELFIEVWNILEEHYPFEEPSSEEKVYAAISGLARSYDDPYTSFLPPVDAHYFNETVSGAFGGIGAEVTSESGYIVVISPLKESPAQKAGLQPGDVITTIDGTDAIGMPLNKAVSLMRGDTGTDVILEIVREDEPEQVTITITRDIVSIPVIETEAYDDTFVITLFNFNEESRNAFTAAIQEFSDSGKERLLLDLRNNPGGYLEAANYIASYFLPQGEVIVKEDSGKNSVDEKVYRSTGHELLQRRDFELGILVNRGSASASEILAIALQEHDKATILGETTYGKGSVQELIQLPQDTALKVTIAKWVSPDGTYLEGRGVIPDVVIDDILSEDEQLQEALASF